MKIEPINANKDQIINMIKDSKHAQMPVLYANSTDTVINDQGQKGFKTLFAQGDDYEINLLYAAFADEFGELQTKKILTSINKLMNDPSESIDDFNLAHKKHDDTSLFAFLSSFNYKLGKITLDFASGFAMKPINLIENTHNMPFSMLIRAKDFDEALMLFMTIGAEFKDELDN